MSVIDEKKVLVMPYWVTVAKPGGGTRKIAPTEPYVFVLGNTHGIVDGESVVLPNAVESGTHSYSTVGGGRKTVRLFESGKNISFELFLRLRQCGYRFQHERTEK